MGTRMDGRIGRREFIVTMFDFPGRRQAEWLMLMPLAVPAYVVAYAYTDFLQYSGPLQTTLRSVFGLQGRVFPEVRSVGGAAWVFIFTLYPYVYLLARTALGERAVQMMEAARLLGAGPRRRILEVALPLARPAITAGVALALMETLADYGVGAYFGLTTFSTGIFKAWLVMNDGVAAALLALVLLLVVALLLAAERAAQRRLRFASSRAGAVHAADARPLALHGAAAVAAWALCALPVLLPPLVMISVVDKLQPPLVWRLPALVTHLPSGKATLLLTLVSMVPSSTISWM